MTTPLLRGGFPGATTTAATKTRLVGAAERHFAPRSRRHFRRSKWYSSRKNNNVLFEDSTFFRRYVRIAIPPARFARDDEDDVLPSAPSPTSTAKELLRQSDEPMRMDWKPIFIRAVKTTIVVVALARTVTTLALNFKRVIGGGEGAVAQKLRRCLTTLGKAVVDEMISATTSGGFIALLACGAAAVFAAMCVLEKEKMERDRLVPAVEARDANSRFADVDGVSVHHKYFAPRKTKKEEESGGTLLSCAHGFGANTYSYEMAFVDAALKKSENVGVVCYDSVGFGLTERPRTDLMKFTKVFNAKCLKAMAKKYARDGDTNNYTKKKKKKVVYVGHSLGAIAATLTTTLEDGDDDDAKPSALILIAPAFLVKQEKQKKTKKKDDNTFDGEEGEKSDERRGRKEKATPKKKVISPDDEFYDEELFNRVVLSSLKAAWGCVASLLFNIVAKPLLYVILRTIVRSKQFWRNGLSKVVAKSKASLVDDSWIDGYRRPRVVQNWDLGMINFVSASLNDLGTDLKAMFRRHMRIYADKPTEYDLSMNPMDALRKSAWENNVPILIVHGAEDAIVPASNSVSIRNRLLTAPPNARPDDDDDDDDDDEIPETSKKVSQNSPPPPPLQNPSPPFVRFVAMERVGHCPHEEDPETFATVALTFLKDAGCLAL